MTAMMPGQYSYGPAQGQSYGYRTSMGANGTGFQFRKRFERVDWRKIASVDVDRISRELDFHSLQDNIMNITFCDIQQEVDLRMVDPTFVKLFRLAQLTIEYLLHSQDYLTNIVASHDEKLRKANEEHEKTRQEMGKLKEELQKVKQESRKRKKMLAAQQLIMQAGANNYHKCPHCNKAFLNSSFLQQHVYRRHPESLPPSDATMVQSRAATQKLEGELTEIKERLRLTESQLQDERNQRNLGIAQDMEKQQRVQDQSRKEMEAWKELQEKKYQEQMEKMSNMFMKELKEVNEKYQASQNALLELQKSGPRSNLGALRDDMEEEREMLRKQQEEVQQLKEELNDKMSGIEANMKGDLKSQLNSQEDKWKNRMRKMQDKHTQELEKMNSLLSDSTSALQNEREGIVNKSKKKDQQVEEMIRRAKEQERLIKQQRKQIDELASRPPAVAPRSEGKPPVSPSPPKRGPSPQKVPVIREPSPETTEESESEEEEEDESTMEDTMLSTNDLTGTTRSLRLVEALKKNPTLIQGIKNELEEELQVNLEKRGIRPGTTGITAQSLENKLKILKTERVQIAEQYKEFWDVRQQHLDFVDRRAKELQKSPKSVGSRPSSAQTGGSQQRGWSDQTPPPVRAAQKRPRPDSGAQRQGQGSKVRKDPPKPAPRTATPDRLDREHLSATGTLTSTGSEDDYSLSSESEVSLPEIHDAGPRTPSPTPTPQPRQRTPSSPQPAPRGGAVAIPHAGEDETESNWDSESGSELEEISPSKVKAGTSKPRSPVSAVRQPQGTIVKELAQSIEAQLTGRRRDDKKPAGAVDAMSGEKAQGQANRRTSRDSFEDEEDDSHDTFSLSSLSENPDGRNRSRPPTAGTSRHHDSDSTNTLGTSVWGSSAGARAMKDQTTGRPSSVKSSLVSVTDWDDDDLDLSDL
ncbi:cilium assembly protein DZIP1L-like [Branchiostoma floridae x Branchiostoma japonicum]